MRRALFTFLSALALIATGVVGAIAVGGTGTVDPPPRIAFLANGIVPADALAAGGIAGQLGAPLFTTPADTLNDDARDGLVVYDPDLIIVLGGPVAIDDAVVASLSAATGLAVVAAEDDPDDGIVRVAGGDRFATARAVADLLSAYDPAYLPVDATALGAVDADQLDGRDGEDVDNAATTMPLGTTRTGDWGIDYDASGTLEQSTFLSFPFELTAPARYELRPVDSAPTDSCPGSPEDPTAAPGWFCFYVSTSDNIIDVCPARTIDFGCATTTSVRGGGLAVRAASEGRATITGSWAVTNSDVTPSLRRTEDRGTTVP